MDEDRTKKAPTLYEQARAKLDEKHRIAEELLAWEAELSRTDYYDWFLDQVKEEAR